GGGGTYVAFLVAGLVALVTAYSYARLSVAVASDEGTVSYLDEAFGEGTLTGSLNVLLWIAYVITTSLYAYAFGSYGATFASAGSQAAWSHVLITAAIVVFTALNVLSAKLIAAAEDYIVAAKIAILVAFVAYAMTRTDLSASTPSHWERPGSLVAGGMLVFVAYEGFELIANAAEDIRDPKRTIPRALYTSVLFTIVLYMLVAVVTVGLLSATEIVRAADFALAEAAQRVWGSVGFDLIVVAALLSTASAINATLYGTARLSVDIALDGELPSALEDQIAGKPLVGLFLTAGFALLVANLVPLEAISSMASAAFLIVFAAVNAANVRLADRTSSRRWLSVLGAVMCVGALVALLAHIAGNRPQDLVLMAVIAALTVVGERTYQLRRRRRPLSDRRSRRGAR
ncbi:MAG: amino acid permease, partial [Phycisphaerales bacterium]|nr:amino acid permease [Phycisphaerales bacterium]